MFITLGVIGEITSKILGLFEVNFVLAFLYSLFGFYAFFAAAKPSRSKQFVKISAFVFTTISIFGIAVHFFGTSLLSISLGLTSLHIFIAGVFMYLHFLSNRQKHFYKVA